MTDDNQTSLGMNAKRDLKGKVSQRRRELAKKKAVEVVSFFLQQEATLDTKVNNYTDLFDITQEEGFLRYQKAVHERRRRDEVISMETIVQGLIQMKGLDELITTLCGYLWATRKVIAHANENMKQAGHDALSRYDGEITGITGMDKEKRRWRMQFNPAHPESVSLKRVRKDNGRGRVSSEDEVPSHKSTKDSPPPSPTST